MREHRYRAWDKVNKRMWPVIEPMFGMKKAIVALTEKPPSEGGGMVEMQLKDLVVMEYTGVKDINGNEICEGDMVQAMMCYGPAGMHETVVEISYDLHEGYRWSYFDLDTIQIVGHKFDKPDVPRDE